MSLWALAQRLLRSDVRLIGRDRLLGFLLAMVVVVGVAGVLVLPVLDTKLAAAGVLPGADTTLRFSDTFPMFVAFIGLWQAALMPGTIFGFMLLDEKEDDTLTAMQVTPVPLDRYLAYRVALPTVLAFAFILVLEPTLATVLRADQGQLSWGQRIPVALAASLVAPTTALVLSIFAANKVQGLAFTKFTGIAGLVILFGWFVPLPWQWALGLFPPFLVTRAYWMALAGESFWWAVLALGLALELGLLLTLVRRFRALVVR